MLDKTVYETKFVWEDVLYCMDDINRKYFLNLPEEKQKKIIEEKGYLIEKYFGRGLMYDWVAIMQDAILEADLYSDIGEEDERAQ